MHSNKNLTKWKRDTIFWNLYFLYFACSDGETTYANRGIYLITAVWERGDLKVFDFIFFVTTKTTEVVVSH